MAELLLFHHAQGLTAGCLAFADELRAAGHVVHVPDLFEGKTFATLDEGIGHAERWLHRSSAARGPGDRHLFAEAGLPDYDEAAATLLELRVLDFLAVVG